MISFMKTLRFFLVMMLGAMLSSLTLTSCLNDDDNYSLDKGWVSVATLTPLNDDSFYLTLDDGTTLFRAAGDYYTRYYPEKRQRAQVNFTILGDDYSGYDHAIRLNRVDTILTKSIAKDLGVAENDAVYGKDVISIEENRVWVGDDFLNFFFKFNYTLGSRKHFINLIPADPTGEDPYFLEFRHNAYGDTSGDEGAGLVAFDLLSLPDTEGKEVTLKIKIKTREGEKIIEKKYHSGKTAEKKMEESLKSFENILE